MRTCPSAQPLPVAGSEAELGGDRARAGPSVLHVAFGTRLPAPCPDANGILYLSTTPLHSPEVQWEPLARYMDPPAVEAALDLLRELERRIERDTRGPGGSTYPDETAAALFHRQILFDHFLLPFTQYRRLLETCAGAEKIYLHDPPADLTPLLSLVPSVAHRIASRPRSRVVAQVGWRLRSSVSRCLLVLLSVVAAAWAWVARPRTAIYSVDAAGPDGSNRWTAALEGALRDRGERFITLRWTPGGRRALGNFISRPRPSIYLNALIPVEPSPRADIDHEDVTESLLLNLERHLRDRAEWSRGVMRRYASLISHLPVRAVYMMDDYVHGFEVIAACRRVGIPTVAFQHGQINGSTVGLLHPTATQGAPIFADRFCVWSELFRDLLIRNGSVADPESIVVTGALWTGQGGDPMMVSDHRVPQGMLDPAGQAALQRRNGSVSEPIRVLFLGESYDQWTLEHEVEPYVLAMESAGMEVSRRAHPRSARRGAVFEERRSGESSGHPQARVRRPWVMGGRKSLPTVLAAYHTLNRSDPGGVAVPLREALRRADVVVGSFSSALFEAILAERPVVLIATCRYADPHGLARNGAATLVTSPADLPAAVAVAASTPAAELRRRRQVVWRGAELHPAIAVLEAMDGLLESRPPPT